MYRAHSFGSTIARQLLHTTTAVLFCCVGQVNGQTGSAHVPWNAVLDQPASWYASGEALRIAENVLLYQHQNGGWPKNVDMARMLSEADRIRISDELRSGGTTLSETTLDNDATYRQMRFLERVHDVTGDARLRASLLRGVDYILAAQYDNGGWPQYFPIRRGYYEHVTFNDGAMIHAMRVLREVAAGAPSYTFVDPDRRVRAAAAVEKGIGLILRTQVEADGRLTAWCAQYDHVALTCADARAYELASLSGYESVDIVRLLMGIESPGPEVVRAIESAIAWFERVKLSGIAVIERPDPTLPRGFDRVVVEDATAPPHWARFYEIGTDRPIFVGRDGIVRYSLSEIEHERRIGYRWLGMWAIELLETEYPAWRKRYRSPKSGRASRWPWPSDVRW